MADQGLIRVGKTTNEALNQLFARHPFVELSGESALGRVEFDRGDWPRSLQINATRAEVNGLIEIVDNNPLVCADDAACPDPLSTLALIALAPLIRGQILVESPLVITNAEGSEEQLNQLLEESGWTDSAIIQKEAVDLGQAVSAIVLAKVETPSDLELIDALYDESYGRSFFVRRDETSNWDVVLVNDRPWAVYRLGITPDAPHSLLRIQVMADQNGKCGAAQIMHWFNVMNGFEESLPFA